MKDIIILAAGIGSRLRPLTDSVPKTMVEVQNDTILNRLLTQIKRSPTKSNVHIATGYRHEQIAEHLSQNGHECNLVLNKDYATTNNMYSLHLVLKEISNTNDLLIINADCVYDEQIVHDMLAVHDSRIAVDKVTFLEESMKVQLEDNLVRGISKTFKSSPHTFVSIDIYHFDNQHKMVLSDIVNKTISNGELNSWTEVAINELARNPSTSVSTLDIGVNKWVEIDDYSDLEKANKIM